MSGIYALGKLGRDSEEYKQLVVFILSSYLRKHSSKKTAVPAQTAKILLDKFVLSSDVEACKEVFSQLPGNSLPISAPLLMDKWYDESTRNNVIAFPLYDTNIPTLKIQHMIISGDFRGSILDGSSFMNCFVRDSNFTKAQISSSRYLGSAFLDCDFNSSDLSMTNFSALQTNEGAQSSSFRFCTFREANCNSSDFSEAQITGCFFQGADLVEATLADCDIKQCYFEFSNMSKADFKGAVIESLDSDNTTPASTFEYADLTAANFKDASLGTSSFKNANLKNTDFSGADLSKVRDVTKEQLSFAKIDKHTKLPEAFLNNAKKKTSSSSSSSF